MLPLTWTLSLILCAAGLAQAVRLDPNAENGIYTFERQPDGSLLTKREYEIEETMMQNANATVNLAKRGKKKKKKKVKGPERLPEEKYHIDDFVRTEEEEEEAGYGEDEVKIPAPPLKDYPQNWIIVPLPPPEEIFCPERYGKIKISDYEAAAAMLAHYCNYYFVKRQGHAAFVHGTAVVYVCNRWKDPGICSGQEWHLFTQELDNECLPGYPGWARYPMVVGKSYGRDVVGNTFCDDEDLLVRPGVHDEQPLRQKQGQVVLPHQYQRSL